MTHAHPPVGASSKRTLTFAIILTLLFVSGEFVAGYLSHSLALISDSGHNLADAIALALSWYALNVTLKPHDSRKTFGYHRAGTLTALVNAVSLVVIAIFILVEAVERIRHPQPIMGGVMIVVAIVAVLLNALIGLWLHKGAQHDLNMRSAYLHMLGDALAGVGVVIAGIVIWLTGKTIVDPIVSILIGALILYSSKEILQEAIDTLMEATPSEIDVRTIDGEIRKIPGVRDLHCLHVWRVGSEVMACSSHVTIEPEFENSSQKILHSVIEMLEKKFDFAHTTIQIEVAGDEPTSSCEDGLCKDEACLSPSRGNSSESHSHD